jgi:hypothetical protein
MATASPHDSPPSPAVPTVADRLRSARKRRFVGRGAELELFRSALAAPDPPFSVLWVVGPGGVGKTTLLGALADEAADLGREPLQLDLRGIEPSPSAFAAEVARLCGLPADVPARDALTRRDRPVLLLDTVEAALGLEGWLREAFVPALPGGALTVIAGRTRPGEAWRRDAGWQELLRVVSLRNLGREDARRLLERGGVPEALHERMLELTHGHPLALSLLLDVVGQEAQPPLELADVPDVVAALVESFLAGVPSPRHRRALELAARARFTTAGLLRAAFGEEEGEALFAWLRGLSFVEAGPHGLFPHDLAREVINADLRWRDAAAFADVQGQVRRDVVARLTSRDGAEQQRAFADLMFLHRMNPAAPQLWDWESLGEVYADELREGDHAAIVAMVERHEGPESASIAAHWLERQPWAFVPFRGRGPEPLRVPGVALAPPGRRAGARARPRRAGGMGARAAPRPAPRGRRGGACAVPDGPARLPGAVAVVQRGDDAHDAGVADARAAGLVLLRVRRSAGRGADDGLHPLRARRGGRLRARRAPLQRVRA